MASKLEGGGGKALVARPIVEELFFCSFPYQNMKILCFYLSGKLHTVRFFKNQVFTLYVI